MKRGFILAILSLFIVITFGGFGVPEKGHASVYSDCANKPNADLTTCDQQQKAFDLANPATTAVTQTSTTGFYSNCLKTKGDTPANRTACAAELDTLTLQNNGGIDPGLQSTYNAGAANLYLAEATAKTKYTDCWKNANGDKTKCTNELAVYNAATLAVDNFKKQVEQNGYSLTNSSQRVSTTIKDITPECKLFDNPLACIDAGLGWFIQHTLLTIGGWFLTMGGSLLDWSISSGILNFKQWVPDQITGLWKLVRDVLYLCIVFIGFYLAFMYIIGRDEKFKKFIPWLIIFALFVNFSLPITRAMIDMSNIVALNIYNSAVPDASTGAGTAIMNKIGLSTLLMDQSKNTPTIAVSILSVIFVFFAAWVFFQVAILMMIRTVTLTLCLICSPFLLIDSLVTIPAFGEHVKKIRSIFFNQLFMADVFMIIFFITLQVMNVLKPKESITNVALAGTGVGNIGLIFGIFMMMILLHFMLKITKSMSGEVGALATGAVNTGVGMLAGGAMGMSAMAGRASIGRLAAKARDSSWVKNNQDSFIGRKAYDFSHSVANSSMDARNSGVAQKFSATTGMKLGKGSKIGYEKEEALRQKDILERGKRINTSYTKDLYDTHKEDVVDAEGKVIHKKGETNYGEFIHRKGDVNEAGAEAALRYQKKAGGVLLANKDTARENILASNKERQQKQDSEINEGARLYMGNHQNKKDALDKLGNITQTKQELQTSYLKSLESDLAKIKKVDENGSGVEAQKLIQAIDAVKNKKPIDKLKMQTNSSGDFQKMIEAMVEEKMKAKLDEEKHEDA